jgi:hypothetical protein
MDLRVRIEYKNKDLVPVSVQDYALRDYVDLLRIDLMRLIGEVENALY